MNEPLLQYNNYTVHIATSVEGQGKSNKFVEQIYKASGYSVDLDTLPTDVTFQVLSNKELVGTVTARVLEDNPYTNDVSKKVCEISKFAVSEHSNKELLALLFNLTYIYAHIIYKADTAFIEVNPNHISFYGRTLGFIQAGGTYLCKRVNAPAALMYIEAKHIKKRAEPIYRYFLPIEKEQEIARKIKRILEEQ